MLQKQVQEAHNQPDFASVLDILIRTPCVEKHGKAIFTINLLMVCYAWCPNEDVKLDASKDWLVMCLPNLLLEHFFLLEKDWLTLLEIRLLLKRCEAATFTLASKV
jgi:hypothetical protein